jgi:hypothetical protein
MGVGRAQRRGVCFLFLLLLRDLRNFGISTKIRPCSLLSFGARSRFGICIAYPSVTPVLGPEA